MTSAANDPNVDPGPAASRPADGAENGGEVPSDERWVGSLTPGTSSEEGLSTVPLSAEDLVPDDDLGADPSTS